MRLLFGRRRKPQPATPPPEPVGLDSLAVHDMSLRLAFSAKSGDGVRLAGEAEVADLPGLLAGLALSEPELIEPLPPEAEHAAPHITEPEQAMRWVTARRDLSPVARHALWVLESLDALDPAFETSVIALLHGETDQRGVPRFDAIVGGLVSHWDESTGELVLRPVVAWGGTGTRGDTDRQAQRLLLRLMKNVLTSQGAHGLHVVERAVSGGGARTCGHCGFPSLDRSARYCPKCGMRQDH
jgi:hypothetical protein